MVTPAAVEETRAVADIFPEVQERVRHIDGLRAVAVLSVVLEHAASYVTDPRILPGFLLRNGMHGVDLFFVISGFCLSYPVLLRLQTDGVASFDVAAFAVRRIVRILPPYYIAVAVLALAAVAAGRRVPIMDVLTQLCFLDRNGQSHMLNSSFWTLPVEFRWYFLFPALLFVWTRSPRAFAAIAMGAAFSASTKFWSEDVLILPAFMLGIVAAQVHVRRYRCSAVALPAFLIFAVLGVFTTPANWDNYAYPLWQAAAFCLVVGADSIGFVTKILSSKIISAVGVASYSIYLVHGPVIEFLYRHNVDIRIAAAGGVLAGFIFWAIAEWPFVQGPLRKALLSELSTFAPRWVAFAGLPVSVRLEQSVAYARMPKHDEGSPIGLVHLEVTTPGTG